ncbi:MAG: response regulator [Lachnospiraceae bacterium]|nr:response regulator [Lachnospiraceae bacterium]
MKKNGITILNVLFKFGKRNMIAMVASILFFIMLISAYFLLVYNYAHESVIAKGETNAIKSAEQFDSYLITEKLIIEQARYRLNKMLNEGSTEEEILDFIVDDTNYIITSVNDKITGLYAYIDGKYYDGALWEPDDPGWVATERPWYVKTVENNGKLTLIEPYVDVQTNAITMTVAQTLNNSENVVAIDISFDMIQMITEEDARSENQSIQMVLNTSGDVLAHSDVKEIGHNYLREDSTLGAAVVDRLIETDDQCFELNHDGIDYVVYVVDLNDSWYSVSLIDSSSSHRLLRLMIIVTIIVILLTVIILSFIFINLSAKNIIADRLNSQLSCMSDIYMLLIDIDVFNNSLSQIRRNENMTKILDDSQGNAQETLHALIDVMVKEEFRDSLHEFIDFDTLDERLAMTNTTIVEFIRDDGLWCRGRFVASERTPEGRLSHVLCLIEDIDEEKRKRDELIDMSARAIAASEAKSTFLSNMSHEIRTPINAILGMNEMILRECDDKDIIEYADSIQTASNTLLGIVNDILDFSKIEAGKMEIIPVDYDLASVLNDLVNMIQTRIDEKGLLLELDFDRHIPSLLHGDEVRIKQVITNILTNAAKYTEYGTVTFRVGYDMIPDEPDNIMLRVEVKDTGIGIRKEDMDRLFTEFDRIDEERNRNIEGTGLGIAITQSLLNMMGSSLEVKSRYGQGSVFGFSLKQTVVSFDMLGDYEKSFRKSLESRKQYKEKFSAKDARVLIIDDTQMNIMVFKSLLKKTMIRIDTSLSGDEGIAAALKNKYDIIFLDHMMPHKDGIETLRELKALTDNPNIDTPVICLTANAISGAREQYLAVGFDDYLTKPIDPQKLEEMMIRFLPKSKVKIISDVEEVTGLITEDASGAVEKYNVLKEIDAGKGIVNCGSSEDYDSILDIFRESYGLKSEELNSLYASEDWENYTVKVHALKSSAFIIGADGLGELARELENAGKADNIDHIRAGHEHLMKMYEDIKEQLDLLSNDSMQDNDKGGRPYADPALLAEAYNAIGQAADVMDTDAIEEMLNELSEYELPDNAAAIIGKIKEKFHNFDYDGITELLKEIII